MTFDYVSVFVVYAIVEACQWPLWDLQLAMVDLFTSLSSLERLQTFLGAEECHANPQHLGSGDEEKASVSRPRITFSNADIGFRDKSLHILESFTAEFPTGCLTMVVGQVASGKSALCAAILGEADLLSGEMSRIEGRYAYCCQDAFITDQSVKENILFESPMDQLHYQRCLRAVAIDQDIQSLTLKDDHPAKQLSGGQKSRIALCRALYSRADVCKLLDLTTVLDPNESISCLSRVG